MKQEITAQVHMLPQDKEGWNKGELVIDIYGLCIAEHESDLSSPKWKTQHLYFISNNEIKRSGKIPTKGTWCYRWYDKSINNHVAVIEKYREGLERESIFLNEIIASTDPALGLSAIPAAWIKEVYVPSNGSIKEVKLELITGYFILSTNNEPDKWVEFNKPRLRHINSEVVIVDEPTEEPIEEPIDPTYRHYKFDEPQDTRILDNIVPQIANGTFNIDQELEDAAEKASLRIYAYESEPRINRDAKIGFIDGAEWQKEQSAKHAIEFAEWTRSQEDLGYIPEDKIWGYVTRDENGEFIDDKEYTSKQLYELWKSKQ
jgi:hypothetical protein